jgi:hypothetical protein
MTTLDGLDELDEPATRGGTDTQGDTAAEAAQRLRTMTAAVENLMEFFQHFRRLNVRSNEELDGLVEEARRVVQGVEPQSLRENGVLRQSVAQGLGELTREAVGWRTFRLSADAS